LEGGQGQSGHLELFSPDGGDDAGAGGDAGQGGVHAQGAVKGGRAGYETPPLLQLYVFEVEMESEAVGEVQGAAEFNALITAAESQSGEGQRILAEGEPRDGAIKAPEAAAFLEFQTGEEELPERLLPAGLEGDAGAEAVRKGHGALRSVESIFIAAVDEEGIGQGCPAIAEGGCGEPEFGTGAVLPERGKAGIDLPGMEGFIGAFTETGGGADDERIGRSGEGGLHGAVEAHRIGIEPLRQAAVLLEGKGQAGGEGARGAPAAPAGCIQAGGGQLQGIEIDAGEVKPAGGIEGIDGNAGDDGGMSPEPG